MKIHFISIVFLISLVEATPTSKCTFKNSVLNCSQENWREVPAFDLAHKVEKFDLTLNHIRELTPTSFQWYINLQVLILRGNVLCCIVENALSRLTKLTTLDLSINVLLSFPCNLPPSLVHLNLADNRISDHAIARQDGCLQCLSPLTSLETLSLRKNILHKFPAPCEATPNLLQLDVSENTFDSISSENLALLCGLEKLNFSAVKLTQSGSECQRWQFAGWLSDRGVEMIGSVSRKDGPPTNCSSAPSSQTNSAYQQCLQTLYFRKYLWLAVGGFSLLVLCILVALYALWRRKRKRSAKNFDIKGCSLNVAYKHSPSSEKIDKV